MSLRDRSGKFLWSHIYCEAFDALWVQAFFIPLKSSQFEIDLNHSGYPKIAIAVFDHGTSLNPRPAVIFTVKERKLVPYAVAHYYVESGEPLFP